MRPYSNLTEPKGVYKRAERDFRQEHMAKGNVFKLKDCGFR